MSPRLYQANHLSFHHPNSTYTCNESPSGSDELVEQVYSVSGSPFVGPDDVDGLFDLWFSIGVNFK